MNTCESDSDTVQSINARWFQNILKKSYIGFSSVVFYALCVWFEQCKSRFKTRFRLSHFRLLRTACKDYGLTSSKAELTAICKRVTLEEWTKFATASKVTIIMRDEQPKQLFTLMQRILFVEHRRWGFGKFSYGFKMGKGHQALQNRLEIIEPWLDQELNDDKIRILMKKSFFNYLKIWSFLMMMIAEKNEIEMVAACFFKP